MRMDILCRMTEARAGEIAQALGEVLCEEIAVQLTLDGLTREFTWERVNEIVPCGQEELDTVVRVLGQTANRIH